MSRRTRNKPKIEQEMYLVPKGEFINHTKSGVECAGCIFYDSKRTKEVGIGMCCYWVPHSLVYQDMAGCHAWIKDK